MKVDVYARDARSRKRADPMNELILSASAGVAGL